MYKPPMIELSDIGFAYGATPILQELSLSVTPGELVMIVGPNGAGKSTALRIIAGLLQPSTGRARVLQRDPYATRRRELSRRVAFLPQSYRLSFPFTASEVVLMGRYPHEHRGIMGFDSQDAKERAKRAMQQCGVLHLASRRINELSGGEIRRVQIAQALCQEADLLLLDEPTASLDPGHAIELVSALRQNLDANQQAAKTIVIVTHDLNLAGRFASRLLLLHKGRLCADDKPAAVLQSPALADAFQVEMFVGTLPALNTSFVVPH